QWRRGEAQRPLFVVALVRSPVAWIAKWAPEAPIESWRMVAVDLADALCVAAENAVNAEAENLRTLVARRPGGFLHPTARTFGVEGLRRHRLLHPRDQRRLVTQTAGNSLQPLVSTASSCSCSRYSSRSTPSESPVPRRSTRRQA